MLSARTVTLVIGIVGSWLRKRYPFAPSADQPAVAVDAGSVTTVSSPLPAASYTTTVAPPAVGSPADPTGGTTMRCAGGSFFVDDLNVIFRFAGFVGSSRR